MHRPENERNMLQIKRTEEGRNSLQTESTSIEETLNRAQLK